MNFILPSQAIKSAALACIWVTWALVSAAQAQPQCLPTSAINCSTGYLKAILPVMVYSEVFESACVRHDLCYRHGRVTYNHSKSYCATEFRSRMRATCSDINWRDIITLGGNVAACYAAAQAFYAAVGNFGGSAWASGPKTYCEYDGPGTPGWTVRPPGLPRPPLVNQPTKSPTVLGGIDVDRHCKIALGRNYTAISVGPRATDWRCQWRGDLQGISMQSACEKQYSHRPVKAIAFPPGDISSWRCVGA